MNKRRIAKIAAVACAAVMAAGMAVCMTACSDDNKTSNTLFLYPLNYYALKGRGFTARWQGMTDALADYGWEVSGDNQKDSTKFRVSRTDSCTMPSDTEIVFVNNQTWSTNTALVEPLSEKKPIALLSTCNGVEFCSASIEAWSPETENATMAGFSESYEEAFRKGTLKYLAAKYSASVAPLVGLVYNACATGKRLENENGEAINIAQGYGWDITSYDEYMEAQGYDNVGDTPGVNPTIMKADMDAALPATSGGKATYQDFYNFVQKTTTYEGVKALFNANRDTVDTPVTTREFKVAIITPGSINDSVGAYIKYMTEYASKAYNMSFKNYAVDGKTTQIEACTRACDAGVDAIITLQDDTDRLGAIQYANAHNVFFAVCACAVGDEDYETEVNGNIVENPSEYSQVKDLPYFIGAVGSTLQNDHDAAYRMTKHYLQKIVDRAAAETGKE